MKKVVLFGSALALSLALSGCGSSSVSGEETGAESAGGTESETTVEEEAVPDYSVADEAIVDKGYGMYAITGTLTNNTDDSVSYIQVEYVLKDADGAQIGTGLANTTNLASGSAWKYEALCTVSGDDAPVSFELVEVTGF